MRLTRCLFSDSLSFGLRNLRHDRRGTIAVTTALGATALFGFAGLAIDVSSWQVAQRSMQGVADAAAYSAAVAYSKSNGTSIVTQAEGITAARGYVAGQNGVTVAVNQPPTSGPNTGIYATAIEVIIQQPQPRFLSGLLLSSNPAVTARAVAAVGAAGNGCVIALDRAYVIDLGISGGVTVNLNNCSLYINSDDTQALNMSGGAIINARSAFITGNYVTSGGASLNTTSGTFTGVSPISDPYAGVPIPSYSGCNQTSFNLSGGASKTLSAGSGAYVFCNGINVSGNSSLTLNPGIYVINGGQLNLSGGTTFNATGGVTIVFTSSTGSGYATANISGGAIVNITTPASGSTAGLAFFQDRNASSSGTDSFSGGATQNITGAIYFPNQAVNYSGGSATGGAQCTQLIAYTMTFSGGSTFNNNCVGVGTAVIGGSPSKIVE